VKKFVILLFFLTFFTGMAGALVYKDRAGSFYCIKDGSICRSQDEGRTWISSKIETSEAWLDENPDGDVCLFYKKDNRLFMSRSKNHGISFDNKQAIYNFSSSPESLSVGFYNGYLQLTYQSDDNLYYTYSSDSGQSFAPALLLNNNLPVARFSGGVKEGSIVFLSKNKLYYLSNSRGWTLPQEIYQAQGIILSIIDKKDAIFWIEKPNEGEYDLYNWDGKSANLIYKDNYPILELNLVTPEVLTFSLFKENHYLPSYLIKNIIFGSPKPIKGTVFSNEQYEGSLMTDNGIAGIWTIGNELKSLGLLNLAPNIPIITIKNAKTNGKLRLAVNSDDPDHDPLVFKIEISPDKNFDRNKRWTFYVSSREVEIPLSFPDDQYYLRAYAGDFISYSPPSETAVFHLDRAAPKLTIIQPEKGAIVNLPLLEIKGLVSEECVLSINSRPAAIDHSAFAASLDLKPGENQILITATDEAGNATAESFTVTLNEAAPVIIITNPKGSNWYKSGASIVIEAQVRDRGNDIQDETDAPIMIDGKSIHQTATFSLDDNKITGVVTLPPDLSEGEHKLSVSISDTQNNLGFCSTTIKVDSSAPEAAIKNIIIAKDGISIPLKEDGSGIDVSGTTLSVKIASLEVTGKIKKEGNNLVFVPDRPLVQGSYEIKIKPRDVIGNVGKESACTMSFNPNLSSLNAQASSSSLAIAECKNGPNPFSPLSGQTTAITYKLSRYPASLKFYLFTIDGEQILSKIIQAASDGKIIWDGKNQAGNSVSSGVYIYALVAQDNTEKSDIKRGKIILLQ